MSRSPTPKIRPYRVEADPTPLDTLLRRCNEAVYGNYSPDYTVGPGLRKPVANPLSGFVRLLELLVSLPDVEFLTMEELIAGKGRAESIRVTIRHDIDADIVAAKLMAELEQQYGVRATHYVLHTAYYYGHFDADGVFHRYEALGPFYRSIEDLGHEVGLHIDPLMIYQDHCIDGASALVAELNWLRSCGIRIAGVAAHNHTSVYGAQNYEIFKGKLRNHHMPGGNEVEIVDVDEVIFKGKWAPLHVLDMEELGLSYEAHDTYAVDGYLGIMAETGFNRIHQTWNVQRRSHERSLRSGPGRTFDDLEEVLKKVRPGEAIVFTTHPEYYGCRHLPDCEPPLRLDQVKVVGNERLGWRSYAPGKAVAVSDSGGRQVAQTISFANEFGMLDRPLAGALPNVRVVLLGSTNLDGRCVGVPDHLASRLEDLLADRSQKVMVRTFAFPGMGVSRYASWYERLPEQLKPAIVLMAIDRNAIAANIRGLWSTTAVGRGQYLAWNEQQQGVEMAECAEDGAPGTGDSHLCDIGAMDPDLRLHEVPWLAYLKACYSYLARRIRCDGGLALLLVEDAGRVEGRDTFLERVRDIATAADLPVIDPQPRFEKYVGAGRTHDDAGRWTSNGHRLAAEAVADAIDERLLHDFMSQAKSRRRSRIMSGEINPTVVNLVSISYTGTTWINTVLGCHELAFALGPPDRFLDLWGSHPEQLCQIHGKACQFWPVFCRAYRPDADFFRQLAAETGKTHIIINNPNPNRFGKQLSDAGLDVRTIYVVRDGRAVSASYARRHQLPYREGLRNWFYPAICNFPPAPTSNDHLIIRYEDVTADPLASLQRLGAFVGLMYEESAMRYWEYDHHPIAGNQGTYAIAKLHHGIPVQDFESRGFYEQLYRSEVERGGYPVRDDRWKEQLSRQDRYQYDLICGDHHARLGYERDQFTYEERAAGFDPELASLRKTEPVVVPSRRLVRLLPAPVRAAARRIRQHLGSSGSHDHGDAG